MLNLMKYEARRLLFTKGIMLGGLLVLVAAFFAFYFQGMETGATIMVILMSLATIMVLFYAPIEFLLTFDKDVTTRQGYLLFLLPKKSTTILTAKLLTALLQSAVIYALFFTIVPFCEGLCGNKFGENPGMIGGIVQDVSSDLSGTGDVVIFFAMLLMLWLFLAGLSMMVSTIPIKGKVASLLGVALFVVAIFVVFFLMEKIHIVFELMKAPEIVGDIAEWVYMIGLDVALFFGTARLLDKKVSI